MSGTNDILLSHTFCCITQDSQYNLLYIKSVPLSHRKVVCPTNGCPRSNVVVAGPSHHHIHQRRQDQEGPSSQVGIILIQGSSVLYSSNETLMSRNENYLLTLGISVGLGSTGRTAHKVEKCSYQNCDTNNFRGANLSRLSINHHISFSSLLNVSSTRMCSGHIAR